MPTNRFLSTLRGAAHLAAAAVALTVASTALPAQQTSTAQTDRGDVAARGDVVIAAGETAHDVVVYGGTLRVLGRVTGDAAVFGGDLVVAEGGEILGDATVAGGELLDEGGRVRGEMRVFDDARALTREIDVVAPAVAAAPSRDEVRREVRTAVREARAEQARARERSWLTPIRRGIAGIVSTVALGLVLAGAGAALVFYGRPYLETVSDTVRASALRAGAVGLAASFLAIPGLIVLIVVLAVSIIGIPFLIATPLYPLAFVAAATFGFLAVAHAVGERTAEQRRETFDLRYRNSYAYLITGIVMFLVPWIAAELIGMTPALNVISIMIKVLAVLIVLAATWVGLGAVILSRAGTRRTFAAPVVPPDLDGETFFDREPSLRSHDV